MSVEGCTQTVWWRPSIMLSRIGKILKWERCLFAEAFLYVYGGRKFYLSFAFQWNMFSVWIGDGQDHRGCESSASPESILSPMGEIEKFKNFNLSTETYQFSETIIYLIKEETGAEKCPQYMQQACVQMFKILLEGKQLFYCRWNLLDNVSCLFIVIFKTSYSWETWKQCFQLRQMTRLGLSNTIRL